MANSKINNITFTRSGVSQTLDLSGKTYEQYSLSITKQGYTPLIWTVFSSFAGENVTFSQNEQIGSNSVTVTGVVTPRSTTGTCVMSMTVLWVKQ